MRKKTIFVFLGIIENSLGQLLMTKRDEEELPDAHGKWEFPSGKVKFAETPSRP
ncbi:MAG: hypothetical protein H6673_15655 [Anaerolineales bacterium]|nr:hypothetical protein [Anaerolineales bacterium]